MDSITTETAPKIPQTIAEKLVERLTNPIQVEAALLTLSQRNTDEAYNDSVELQIESKESDLSLFTGAIESKINSAKAIEEARNKATNKQEFDTAVLQTQIAIKMSEEKPVIHLYNAVLGILKQKSAK